MACETVVTIAELQQALLAMEDLITFTYSPDLTFVDSLGATRETLNGLIWAAT